MGFGGSGLLHLQRSRIAFAEGVFLIVLQVLGSSLIFMLGTNELAHITEVIR